MRFRIFVSEQYILSKLHHHLEFQHILLVFEQGWQNFSYKTRWDRTLFRLGSINKGKVDAIVESNWLKSERKFTDKLDSLTANCIIQSFTAISYTIISTICVQSWIILWRVAFSTYSLPLDILFACITFAAPPIATICAQHFNLSNGKNRSVFCILSWQKRLFFLEKVLADLTNRVASGFANKCTFSYQRVVKTHLSFGWNFSLWRLREMVFNNIDAEVKRSKLKSLPLSDNLGEAHDFIVKVGICQPNEKTTNRS